jgi:hypothetical protein
VKEYYRRLYSDEDTFSNDEKKEERKSETESPKSSKPSSPKNAPASDDASGAMEMDNGRLSATHSKNYHAFFRQFVRQGTSGTNVAKKTG